MHIDISKLILKLYVNLPLGKIKKQIQNSNLL